tara:strand:- start:548 stop:2494 length:1947 start_codon:yes stop_codon:yes gene_type:complete
MTDQPRDRIEGLEPEKLMRAALRASLQSSSSSPNANERSAKDELELRAEIEARLPDLELLELLGRGGMGSVFRARQRKLDREVALKVVYPEPEHHQEFADRFEREARALARLNHPNLVSIFDYGQDGGFGWLLMEFVDGLNLRDLLQAGRLAPTEALSLVPKICDALQYAHDQGVVHRDIKPENILLDHKGGVKIADFGLAKLSESSLSMANLTGAQQVLGTFRYMAPEQLDRPLEVDHRADIYSLGVVLYEMLTGEIPMGRFDPPSAHSDANEAMDNVVLRALEKEPGKRYQHASDVKLDLESAGTGAHAAPRREAAEVEAGLSIQAVAAAATTGIAFLIVAGFTLALGFAEEDLHQWVRRTPSEVLIFGPTLLFVASLVAGPVLGYRSYRALRANWPRRFGAGAAVFGLWGSPLLVANIISLLATLFLSRGSETSHTGPLVVALFTLYALDLAVVLHLRGRFLRECQGDTSSDPSGPGTPDTRSREASAQPDGPPSMSVHAVVSAGLFAIGVLPYLVLFATLITDPPEVGSDGIWIVPATIRTQCLQGIPFLIVGSVFGFVALKRIYCHWPSVRGLGAAIAGAWGGVLLAVNLVCFLVVHQFAPIQAMPILTVVIGMATAVFLDVAALLWLHKSTWSGLQNVRQRA